MSIRCPHCSSSSENVRKHGRFFRQADYRWVQRYFCKTCKSHFSNATLSDYFRQKKRRINPLIAKCLCSGMSQRRIAKIYNINRKTVARKLCFLSRLARIRHESWLKAQHFNYVEFDDLETFEHSKCKPITVTMLVSEKRQIISFGLASIPAKGHLVKIAFKRYGKRPNNSFKMRAELFESLREKINPRALVKSDSHPHYQTLVRKHWPQCEHDRFIGIRGCVTGQGELKKTKFDPLFRINHSFAMLRANINRLFRKTWCTTKKIEALQDHIYLYLDFHNRVLITNQRRDSIP